MIHFFRRIRHSLLKENKFRNYLLYAIGEIALVMIGILLALQVNNWNQSQKEIKIEHQYLEALKEEFLVNTNKLKLLDTLLAKQLDAAHEYILYTHPQTIMMDNTRFSYLMGEGFKDTHHYNPSSGVMKDLINSGKLGLINNAKLRRILADWESTIIRIKEFENESKKASYDVVEILRTKGNFRNQLDEEFKALETGPSLFNTSNASLLQMEIFENSIVYFTATTWRLKNIFYPDLLQKMEEVISIIDEELK